MMIRIYSLDVANGEHQLHPVDALRLRDLRAAELPARHADQYELRICTSHTCLKSRNMLMSSQAITGGVIILSM